MTERNATWLFRIHGSDPLRNAHTLLYSFSVADDDRGCSFHPIAVAGNCVIDVDDNATLTGHLEETFCKIIVIGNLNVLQEY